ncbi:GNAT family N-acetyltransferase [Streptococcus pluranimalium]|uniref:GNAT family N-acetyltransferase n=1 Tax=Streptococcus pluranimalium TaxID=82348 RepID=UPI0039FCF973
MEIRPIQSKDNEEMAGIIRNSLEAVGLDKQGTAYFDPSLDDLAAAYGQDQSSAYFVAVEKEQVQGGAGFGKITDAICELQKFYVLENARGQGLGRKLLEQVIISSGEAGYDKIYLETTEVLGQALRLYESMGFKHMEAPLTNDSGHHAMTIWMMKDLKR